MHFVKTNRTYYKHAYEDYTLPTMTSTTAPEGTVTTNVSSWYLLFFGNSTVLSVNNYETRADLYTEYKFAYPLAAGTYTVSLTAYKQSNAPANPRYIDITLENGEVLTVGEFKINTSSTVHSFTFTTEDRIVAIKYYGTYGTSTVQYVVEYVYNFCLTAEGKDTNVVSVNKVDVESTSTDYDYYEDKHKYYNLVRRQRKYYKYEYETVESLPTYASADEGLSGKNGISFSPANMYFCIAQNVTGSVTNQYGYGVIWSFGDSKFKMDSYSYTGYVIGNRMPQASVNRVEWSNDKVNWTTVTLPDTEYRKYYRFVFDGSETGRYGSMGMRYFNFTGEKRTAIEVQKDDDFDIYTDKLTNYEILNANNYYIFTINPDKEDAVVTINGQIRNSIRLMKNSRITWSVSAENYATQSGVVILTENTVLDIYLKKYAVDEVVFESNTAGTYDIELLENGTYEVFVVGAGGGGSRGQSGNSAVNAGGGSGGYSNALMSLSAGNYSAVVGTGGTAAAFGYPSGGTAGHGSDSSFDTLVAGGGKGGHSGSAAYGGAGGTGTTLNGNTGQAGGGRGVIYGGDSVYGGYGAGGAAQYSVGQWPGGAGYVKIVYKG